MGRVLPTKGAERDAMSKELIERLRKAYGPASDEAYIEDADVLKEAADEIERLRTERNNELKERLDALSDDQRLELMGRYCAHCGCKQPESGMRCQCWNDE